MKRRQSSCMLLSAAGFLFLAWGLPVAGAPVCTVPNAGGWIVESDCDLVSDETAPASVTVSNGATLRITSTGSLGIDLKESQLRVLDQARVLVDPGGRIFTSSTGPADGDDGGDGDTPSPTGLPPLPPWIDLSGGERLIVDLGQTIDGHPRITLPVDFLPNFLPQADGELIIPDNFCGFNIRRAGAFFWLDQSNEVVTDFPYNNVEDVFALGDNDFLGGISFTGPLGQCAEGNEPFQFFQPFTQTGGDSPIPNLKLVVEMRSESEIEFLNFNIHPGEHLSAHELFSEEVFEALEAIAEAFEELEIDNGYCSIDNYVQKVCEEEEEGEAPPGSCPVSDDFESPC